MGILQLIDYVGIEVCVSIMKVMDKFLDEPMHSTLLDKLLAKGVKGGQYPDGSQRDGVFKYANGKPIEVYDLAKQQYVSIQVLTHQANEYLEVQTQGYSWDQLSHSKYTRQHLNDYFSQLIKENSTGARLAYAYLKAMKKIGLSLKDFGVTDSVEYVNTVMEKGFYHLYGPVNDFI